MTYQEKSALWTHIGQFYQGSGWKTIIPGSWETPLDIVHGSRAHTCTSVVCLNYTD